MYIAFFDSGIGGITVLYEALKLLPDEDYLYYADTENVPYGIKQKNKVKEYIYAAVEFIVDQGVDGLVIACNTATSIAIKDLRRTYNIPIIGMEPAVKPAVEICGDKRVLVLATPLTLKEDKYEDLVSKVDSDHIVDSLPMPELVNFAEEFQFDERIIKSYLEKKLSTYDFDQYGTIVLGCTHFVFYKEIFRRYLPSHLDIIDGNLGTVRHLKNVLKLNEDTENMQLKRENINEIKDRNISFYVSGKPEDNSIISKYLKILN